MKKYSIEFIGTFFLMFVVASTGNPIAIGGVLVALVYMGGYISGAHYNPAVTLGLLMSNKIKMHEALRYMLSQLLGSIAAVAVYAIIHKSVFVLQMGMHVSIFSALLVEMLFTFLLVSVVLHVAATDKTKGNDYYGIAIGFTLMIAAFAGGSISGGAFNPAIGVGPIIFDIVHFSNNLPSLVVYLVGPFVGGALASVVYKLK